MMKADEVLRMIEEEARREDLPIIGPARGALLDELVRKHKPRKVLEIGTLVGYSAIRIGRLLPKGGSITCVEINDKMAEVAHSNMKKAGLSRRIEVLVGDAKEVLPTLEGKFDFIFIDAKKSDYLSYLKACERFLRRGSVVVADNVRSFAEEVADYLDYVRNSGKYTSSYREERAAADPADADAIEISIRK